MNELNTNRKKTKRKTIEEKIKDYQNKLEKLEADRKKSIEKKVLNIFSFLKNEVDILEKLDNKEFKIKSKFEEKFKEFVLNLKEKENE